MSKMAGVVRGERAKACLQQQRSSPSTFYKSSSSVYGSSSPCCRPTSSHSSAPSSATPVRKNFHKENLNRLAFLEEQNRKKNQHYMPHDGKESRSRHPKSTVKFINDQDEECDSDASRKSTPEKTPNKTCGSDDTSFSLRSAGQPDVLTHVQRSGKEVAVERLHSTSLKQDKNRFNVFFTPCGIPYTQVQSPRIRRERDLIDRIESSLPSDSRLNFRPTSAPERKLKPGEIPGYLSRRKQEARAEAVRRADEAMKALVPPGFRLIEEAEKRSLLAEVRRLWEETMSEYLKLPVQGLTPSKVQKRRMLEKTIDDLEANIKIFQSDDSLILPETFSLSTFRPAMPPMSEGQRIKMLNDRPRPF